MKCTEYIFILNIWQVHIDVTSNIFHAVHVIYVWPDKIAAAAGLTEFYGIFCGIYWGSLEAEMLIGSVYPGGGAVGLLCWFCHKRSLAR